MSTTSRSSRESHQTSTDSGQGDCRGAEAYASSAESGQPQHVSKVKQKRAEKARARGSDRKSFYHAPANEYLDTMMATKVEVECLDEVLNNLNSLLPSSKGKGRKHATTRETEYINI